MIYLKWFFYLIVIYILTIPYYFAAPFLSLFTRHGWPTWGNWFWTFDNPPQGDRGWILKRCYFLQAVSGFKGYANRVGWLWRNPLYGLGKKIGITLKEADNFIYWSGKYYISDRSKIPCSRFTLFYENKKLKAFEFYLIYPYKHWKDHCLRIRIGWKIGGGSLEEKGFAMFVGVINPFMSYGG